MLFELNTTDCPNWFGVAIPVGMQDFSRANIFFHPLPQQGGCSDSDYTTKEGKPPHTPWPNLFYYMERLGYQMDGAARSRITIMPFLKESALDTGIFLTNWADIVTDILGAVRTTMGADDGSVLQLAEVVVSSYSVGIVYSANFRAGAPNLGTYLSEVWDLDGLYSTRAISYQQISSAHLPTWRSNTIRFLQRERAASTYHWIAGPTTWPRRRILTPCMRWWATSNQETQFD